MGDCAIFVNEMITEWLSMGKYQKHEHVSKYRL